jgi:phosphoribosylformimino-5-aminoimidazole carboxamide ribotide isomerase
MMRLIPVIDIKAGWVVRAVAGQRASYRPIRSRLVADPRPASVAAAFAQRWGFQEAYVADLDAIAGAEPDWAALDAITATGLNLLLDAGVAHVGRAQTLAGARQRRPALTGVVLGLESLPDPQTLKDSLRLIGSANSVFSLDLRQGRPLAACPRWQHTPPEQIAAEVLEFGVRRLIVLDLADVGTDQGPSTIPLLGRLRRLSGDMELIAGGGVRDRDDVGRLAAAGCDGVLVASALHDGRLAPEEGGGSTPE